MDRQWMYDDRCTMVWISGRKSFLDAAEAHKSSKGFIWCPCRICKNNKEFYRRSNIHINLLKRVWWITILFGPSTINLEFWWKTMKNMKTLQTGSLIWSGCHWRWTTRQGWRKCRRRVTTWRTRSSSCRCIERHWNWRTPRSLRICWRIKGKCCIQNASRG